MAIQGSYAPALHSFDPTQQQSCTFLPSGGLAPFWTRMTALAGDLQLWLSADGNVTIHLNLFKRLQRRIAPASFIASFIKCPYGEIARVGGRGQIGECEARLDATLVSVYSPISKSCASTEEDQDEEARKFDEGSPSRRNPIAQETPHDIP